jgi:hypothetical protein
LLAFLLPFLVEALLFAFANWPGGYYVGQIYDELYRPDQLVIDSVKGRTPVIYVAMNYRLGSKLKRLMLEISC